jgi:3-oxoacid CoA-transferase
MDKRVASPEAAIADLEDGATIAITGFGTSAGLPASLLVALQNKGAKNLCVVANSLGAAGEIRTHMLAKTRQVKKLIVSFSARPGFRTAVDEQIEAGEIEVELVPQGTLVERLRAGGAGLAAFYTPTGVGTPVAEGKEHRDFDGKTYLLEKALKVDYAFIRAYRGDAQGNLEFRGSARHFNPSFGKAARVTIAEVEEMVEVGEIPPEQVGLPGIFVSRVVKVTDHADGLLSSSVPRRSLDVAKSYNGKPGWTRDEMAKRAAALMPKGGYVNLGMGIPTLISNHLGDHEVILHAENGMLGYGGFTSGDDIDLNVFNATGQFVSTVPGTAFFDSVTSFEMARGGHLDAVALGAYQVDQAGNLANWSTPELAGGGIGGAMDLVASGSLLMILMEHRDNKDRPKLVRQCTYPLTGVHCVDVVITDLAVLRRVDGRFRLEAVADGFTPEEVIALTDMEIDVAPQLAQAAVEAR